MPDASVSASLLHPPLRPSPGAPRFRSSWRCHRPVQLLLAVAPAILALAFPDLATPGAGAAGDAPCVTGSAARHATDDEARNADSLRTYVLGALLVTASSPHLIGEPGRTEVPWTTLAARDAQSAADVAPLAPGTRAAVNSRGEVLFTMRAASERQLGVFQDGVALDVPWDGGIDASFVPTGVVGAVRMVRGSGSVLDGPNTPGGVIHLLTRQLDHDGRQLRLGAGGGEADHRQASAVYLMRRAPWSFIGGVEDRRRDAALLPRGHEAAYHQSGGRSRTNSDRRQTAFHARLTRELDRRARLAVSVHAATAAKGVPPETHIADARFWRIPRWRRLLAAVQGEWVPDEERWWTLGGSLSADHVEQEIQAYPDATYDAPDSLLDAALESDRDRTLALRLRATRRLDRHRAEHLAAALIVRSSWHRESLERDGPTERFAQLVAGVAGEWQEQIGSGWFTRIGAGVDLSATPESGDKPRRDPDLRAALAARVTRRLDAGRQLHLAIGRRARFPSLRELYSGALGRFVPNPALDAEMMTTLEAGLGARGPHVDWALAGFVQRLDDGIQRVVLPDGRYQRLNVDAIRATGLELSAQWRPRRGLEVDLQQSLLRARARGDDGVFDQPVERRPAFLSAIVLAVPLGRGVTGGVEAVATGSRYGLDAARGGLRRLPPAMVVNLRGAWRWTPRAGRAWGGEVYVRIDNLFDREVLAQPGLPEPGREMRAGMRVEL